MMETCASVCTSGDAAAIDTGRSNVAGLLQQHPGLLQSLCNLLIDLSSVWLSYFAERNLHLKVAPERRSAFVVMAPAVKETLRP